MTVPRREQIVAAARRLLEDGGRESLTMRSLAAQVGIKAPSLYKHVKDRHEIELLLTEMALTEMGVALSDAGPGLQSMGAAYREWAKANPALYRLVTSIPLDRQNLDDGVEQTAEAPLLEAMGEDRDRARAGWAMAHGLVDLELNNRFPPGADIDAAWQAGLAMLSATKPS